MAYCPKCGVEVDNDIRTCPLCEFPVPDIRENSTIPSESPSKYPYVTNIYEDYLIGLKNQIFFVVSVLLISVILILMVIEHVFDVNAIIIDYFYAVAIALAAYVYFSLGFHNWYLNITGVSGTTMVLTYVIAVISNGQWYWTYAFPISLLAYLNAIAFRYIFAHSDKKKRLGYLPAFVLLVVTSHSIGVDAIISWNLHGNAQLSWSLVVAVGCLSVAVILQFVISRIPEATKEMIRRRLHL